MTLAQGRALAAAAPQADEQAAPAAKGSIVERAIDPMAIDLSSSTALETARGEEGSSASLAPEAICVTTVLPNNGGTSGNQRAPNSNHTNGRAVYLITATEMAASGFQSGVSVSGIGWHYSTASGTAPTGTLIVYLQNTTDTTNTKSTTWTTAISGMTTVHSAATTLPNSTTPFDIPFSGGSPFTYTGGGLYVAFDWAWAGPTTTTAIVACNTALVGGLLGANGTGGVPPTTLAASNFRPETRLTPSASPQNEAGVDYLIAYGQLPQGLYGPQTVKAIVTNKGGTALTNLNVSLNVTGANSYSNTQTVASLAACGGQTTVSFAPFTPANSGNSTLTVSVPADDNNANNSLSRTQTVSTHTYSYKYPGTTPTGGVGFTGGTGQFVGKFPITAPDRVGSVIVEFPSITTTTYKIVIYGDNGSGLPGSQLYLDAADRTVTIAGSQTLTLPSPVSVPAGSFFVGLYQTNTTNAGFSFDTENPIRSGSFYQGNTPPTAPATDFSPSLTFKLNIGVVLTGCLVNGDCNDSNPCTDDSCNTGTGLCVATPNSNPCNDNNLCTSPDACSGGTCQGTPSVVCNDNDPCTADACVPQTGLCAYTPSTGGACSDGNACTSGELCGCSSTGLFFEEFDSVTPPALPAGWTTAVTPGTATAWATVSTQFDTPFNSAFTDDPGSTADKVLVSPSFLAGAGQLSFQTWYNTESTFDGMVLEIKIGAGSFQDILTAGGSFTTGGYNGTISSSFGSPIAGRRAWTGNSNAFVPVVVNLPGGATGQSVALRWRLASDSSVAGTGAWVDSIYAPTCVVSCLPGTPNTDPCNDGNTCTQNDTCSGGTCSGTPIGAPPEVTGLLVAANKQTISWGAALTATQYDIVRGAVSALPVGPGGGDEVCLGPTASTSINDPTNPATGAANWYVVRGKSSCGTGSYGTTSGGSPRLTTTCGP